jgi:hypothetical protein
VLPAEDTVKWVREFGAGRIIKQQLRVMANSPWDQHLAGHLKNLFALICPYAIDQHLDTWWFELAHRLISNSSAEWKHVGIDLLKIIVDTMSYLSSPVEYMVEGAGEEEVNGLYVVNKQLARAKEKEERRVFTYVKEPDISKGETKIYTLLRCMMKSKQKWWFISIVDREKPGTDKDTDFYCHRSTEAVLEHRPSPLGWEKAQWAKECRGPPPTLTPRREPHTLTTRYRETQLKWILLDILCSDDATLQEPLACKGYHDLLIMMADLHWLEADDISMLWGAAVSNFSESNVAFGCIVKALTALSLPLMSHLFDLLDLYVTLNPIINLEVMTPVVALVQGFIRVNHECMFQRCAELCWALRKQVLLIFAPRQEDSELKVKVAVFESCQAYSKLTPELTHKFLAHESEQLVATCTSEEVGGGEDQERGQQVDAYPRHLRDRAILGIGTLLNSYTLVESVLDASGIGEQLLDDLEWFIRDKCSSPHGSAANPPSLVSIEIHAASINLRLMAIRDFYGISSRFMTQAMVEKLWSLLKHTPFQASLFLFFTKAGVITSGMKNAYSLEVCGFIFHDILCSPSLEWAKCGIEAYDCFSAHYLGLIDASVVIDAHKAMGAAMNIILNHPLKDCRDAATTNIALRNEEHLKVFLKECLFPIIHSQLCDGESSGYDLLPCCLKEVPTHGLMHVYSWVAGPEILELLWVFIVGHMRELTIAKKPPFMIWWLTKLVNEATADTSLIFYRDLMGLSLYVNESDDILVLVALVLNSLLDMNARNTVSTDIQRRPVPEELLACFVKRCASWAMVTQSTGVTGDNDAKLSPVDPDGIVLVASALKEVLLLATITPGSLCDEVTFDHVLSLLAVDAYAKIHSMVWNFLKCVEIKAHMGQAFVRHGLVASMLLMKDKQSRIAAAESMQNGLCCICYDHGKTVCVMPCRHVCLCQYCANDDTIKALKQCPICRHNVTKLVKVYF